jgi:putative oxidoreductase
VIFAEFFCALFVVIGLFTRVVTIPLIITMGVVVFQVNTLDFFGKAELGALYLAGYLVLLLCGPGKVSVDGIAGK